MLDRLDETVVAVSSAPGYGAVGIVRLSGPDAIAIADRMAVGGDGVLLEHRRASSRVRAEVHFEDGLLPADVYLFHAPKSYTRQNLVEIHTVGSPAAVEIVRKLAVSLGARPAEPGEFTARAFLNGAMDLASAESVARLVSAQSDTQLRAARRMMDGMLAVRIGEYREHLSELLALVEADIDFAEEPIEFITPPELRSRLDVVVGGLSALVTEAKSVEGFNVLPHILLFGPPNAGKSSLMNRLSGTSRAICAAVAGTTRDILSAPISIERGEAVLLDAAGVDESPDEIVAQAREMVLSTAERVDLVCIVLDATTFLRRHESPQARGVDPRWRRDNVAFANRTVDFPPLPQGEGRGEGEEIEDPAAWTPSGVHRDAHSSPVAIFDLGAFVAVVRSLNAPRIVMAVNKCDLLDAAKHAEIISYLQALQLGHVCLISALRGDGLGALRNAFCEILGVSETTILGEAMLLSDRQRTAINDAITALRRAVNLSESAADTVDCADLLAFELREALDFLGTITGAVTTEDLLTSVFANFCIGK